MSISIPMAIVLKVLRSRIERSFSEATNSVSKLMNKIKSGQELKREKLMEQRTDQVPMWSGKCYPFLKTVNNFRTVTGYSRVPNNRGGVDSENLIFSTNSRLLWPPFLWNFISLLTPLLIVYPPFCKIWTKAMPIHLQCIV